MTQLQMGCNYDATAMAYRDCTERRRLVRECATRHNPDMLYWIRQSASFLLSYALRTHALPLWLWSATLNRVHVANGNASDVAVDPVDNNACPVSVSVFKRASHTTAPTLPMHRSLRTV